MNKCCWILKPATPDSPGVFCLKPVKYTMIETDEGFKQRKYSSFCPEHQILADKEGDDDE